MEKITYLVANYNCGKYIEDCIKSVNDQTNPNWLCVIVDDASTDNSIELIRPHLNSKIRLMRSQENIGYIRTLKKLIEESSTDIVGILDGDDALFPDATDVILQAYANNPDAGFIYSNCRRFNEDMTTPIGRFGSVRVPPNKTLLRAGFVTAIKTFRKSSYYRTDGLDESILYAEDRDLVYKLEEVTKPVFIDKPLYKYRTVPDSQSEDKIKQRIGVRNHLRARMDALRRRNIRGPTKAYYCVRFWRKYCREMIRTRFSLTRYRRRLESGYLQFRRAR